MEAEKEEGWVGEGRADWGGYRCDAGMTMWWWERRRRNNVDVRLIDFGGGCLWGKDRIYVSFMGGTIQAIWSEE